ncbi:MAG: Smr/MutS family protein [Chitinophagales bacterium]
MKFNLYPKDISTSLEFDKIMQLLEEACLSELGREALQAHQFSANIDILEFRLKQVAEMKSCLENKKNFPAQNYYNLKEELKQLSIINNVIDGKQFRKIFLCCQTIEDIDLFFKKNKEEYFNLRKNMEIIRIDKNIPKLIDKWIDESGNIRSEASPELMKIRKNISAKSNAIHIVFGRILSTLKSENKLSETQESIRNGRRVLALQAESKRSIQGIIHDESDSGKTTYIEPQETVLLNNELFELERNERREIHKILLQLSSQLRESIPTLEAYQELLAIYDLLRAKGSLALSMNANMPILSSERQINYKSCYHPLLYLKNKKLKKAVVPFDVKLSQQQRILIISGPNAGGKSVSLKTIALLQMMVQFGLLLPCDENSKLCLFKNILGDVGDKQSIEDELSTYSSRLQIMKYFLDHAKEDSLFLIDEFGTGTDPRLGAAMAESLMLALADTKAFGVITTHYGNLKKVAEQDQRFLNGAMVFSEENLSPTYQLQIGKPGSSFTFAIAQKSGLSASIIDKAKSLVDYSDLKFEELIQKLETERKQLEQENRKIRGENARLKATTAKFEQLNAAIEKQQIKLRQELLQLEKAKSEAIESRVNNILNEINNSKSKEVAAKKALELNQLKNDWIQRKAAQIPSSNGSNSSSKNIELGDKVVIGESGTEGEVMEIRGKEAIIAIGGIRTNIALKKLQKIAYQEKKERKDFKKYAGNAEVENVFDIRGLLQEEARPIIEQYFDQALLNNVDSIKIIHGKGMGVLRKHLQQLIKEYRSSISEWRYEEEKKGGNGATIISFK